MSPVQMLQSAPPPRVESLQEREEATVRLELQRFGEACQYLDNKPFVCRTLAAYARVNGAQWSEMLIRSLTTPTGK